MKKIFDFGAFLTSLTRPPMEIMNKEIASILCIQDTVVSKIRHGRLRTIPGQLRPLKNSEQFAKRIVDSVSSSQVVLETFAVYANQLMNEYELSDKLTRLCIQIAANAGDAYMTPQMVERTGVRMRSFFSLCYNEAHFNSSGLTRPKELGEKIRQGERRGAKKGIDELIQGIEQGGFSREELEMLEASLVTASVQNGTGRNLYYDTYYRAYAALLREQLEKPYYSTSQRKETIHIAQDMTIFERQVEGADHLVLRQETPFPHFIQRTLLNFEKLNKRAVLDKIFGEFQGHVNGISFLDYINEHEGTTYKRLDDVIRMTHIPSAGRDIPILQVNLPLTLYPTCPEETFVIETQYRSELPFLPDYSTNYSYRFKYPCRFFAHEHVLTKESAERWRIAMDVFSAFNFAGNDETENPVYHRLNKSDSIPGRSQSVIFHDWVLPGSGYRRSIHEIKK